MLIAICISLLILWLLGVVNIQGFTLPHVVLFYINSHPVTLWNILTVISISWLVRILPTPLRQITSVILILWILSILGVLAVTGLANTLLLVIIVGLVLHLLGVL